MPLSGYTVDPVPGEGATVRLTAPDGAAWWFCGVRYSPAELAHLLALYDVPEALRLALACVVLDMLADLAGT